MKKELTKIGEILVLSCPNCSKVIKVEDAVYCPFCGKPLAENTKAAMKNEGIVHQYEECGRAAALYDNAIWQIPSTAFLITGALISLAYGYVNAPLIRGFVLIICAFWIFTLFVVMNKHMFFVYKQKEKMTLIEVKEFRVSSLQRFSKPNARLVKNLANFKYAFDEWEQPKGIIQRIGAHQILKVGMLLLIFVLIILAFTNFYEFIFVSDC
jgi:hypothetical protein